MKNKEPPNLIALHPLWNEGPQAGTLVDKKNKVEVREAGPLRWLHRCNGAVESVMNLDSKRQLILPHCQGMSLFRLFNETPNTLLNLGLGGGDLVRHLNMDLPHLDITSVELDHNIMEMYQRYFFGNQNQNRIIIADANAYMMEKTVKEAYDVILIDLYSDQKICSFVLSPSFLGRCLAQLTTNGILCINLMTNQQAQLKTLATDLLRLTSRVPLMLQIPGHPNIIAYASPSLPLFLDSTKLLAVANRVDNESTSESVFTVNYTKNMIENNRGRFKKSLDRRDE